MKLSGETVVEKITLDGVRGLRVTLSATVHDVLYYMSPIYCQDIINSVLLQSILLLSCFSLLSICFGTFCVIGFKTSHIAQVSFNLGTSGSNSIKYSVGAGISVL